MDYSETVTKLLASNYHILVQPQERDGAGNFLHSPVLLPEPQRIDYDPATGNLTWSFQYTDLLAALTGLLARNPQQHRTRGGTQVVIADPGARLVSVAFRVGIYSDVSATGVSVGILHLSDAGYDPGQYRQTLTFYRCDRLHLRDGTEVSA